MVPLDPRDRGAWVREALLLGVAVLCAVVVGVRHLAVLAFVFASLSLSLRRFLCSLFGFSSLSPLLPRVLLLGVFYNRYRDAI